MNPDKTIHKAHDRYFRGVMDDKEVALSFISAHLPPEIVSQIDPNSLVLMKESFIGVNLSEFITDVVYSATINNEPGYVYTLMEHQSSPDPLMAFRIYQYALQIIDWDLEKQKQANSQREKKLPYKLPLVIPHVIYNGRKNYTHSTDIFDLFYDPQKARDIFLKPFGLTILKDIDDKDLQKDSLIGMVELLLKHAAARDLISSVNEALAKALQMFETLNKERLINLSLSYLFEVQDDNMSKRDIKESFEKLNLSDTIKTKVMTIADSLKLEGRLEERLVGLQQFRSLLVKQLKSRFPSQVTEEHLRLIKEAASDKLSYWGEKLMTAATIEEVFSPF